MKLEDGGQMAPLPSIGSTPAVVAAFEAGVAAWEALQSAGPDRIALCEAALKLAFELYEGPEGQSSEAHLIYGAALIAHCEVGLLEDEVDVEALLETAGLARQLGFEGEATCVLMTIAHRRRHWKALLQSYQGFPRLAWGDSQHPFFHVERPALQVAEAAVGLGQVPLALHVLKDEALAQSAHGKRLRARLKSNPSGRGIGLGRPILPPAYDTLRLAPVVEGNA